jgi:hypothetical protein
MSAAQPPGGPERAHLPLFVAFRFLLSVVHWIVPVSGAVTVARPALLYTDRRFHGSSESASPQLDGGREVAVDRGRRRPRFCSDLRVTEYIAVGRGIAPDCISWLVRVTQDIPMSSIARKRDG